ncbi:MAG TPA: pectinesterase family protein [Ardenticatenaceae bacterium]
MPRRLFLLVLFACLVSLSSLYMARSRVASAQTPTVENANAVQAAAGSGFTYQGRLLINGTPTSESHDFQFSLYDADSAGTALSTLTKQAVHVNEGSFTVLLDFGANAFNGEARWLEIAVRPAGSAEEYSTLAERQPLTPVPYALFALDTPPIAQVVWVAKSGGDFTSVQAALVSITDASVSKPYLIKVAPGIYTERVSLKPFVAVEGAGEEKTVIRWTGGTQEAMTVPTSATMVGAPNAEVRHLTVESDASGTTNNHAIALWNASSPKLLHVTLRATGGAKSYGIFNNTSASPAMDNLTITASGASYSNTGIYNYNASSPTMTNVQVNASGNGSSNTAVHNYMSSSPRMTDIQASASGDNGSNTAVLNYTTSAPRMTNVQATAQGNTSNNSGVYNYNFSLPRMNHVTIVVSGRGGTIHYGLYNSHSSAPVMDDVTITLSGSSSNNYGVFNTASSDPTMNDVTVTVRDASTNYGIYNSGSHPKMNNVVVDAAGQSASYGVYNIANAMPRMTNVTISATGGGPGAFGVYNYSSAPWMDDVIVKAGGGSDNFAVYNLDSRPVMDSVTASTAGGGNNYGVYSISSSSLTIRNSQLTGSTNSVYRENLSTVNVANSQLVGPVSSGVKCFNNYNASLNAVTCSP